VDDGTELEGDLGEPSLREPGLLFAQQTEDEEGPIEGDGGGTQQSSA